jgi:hypothetical protein
MFPLSRNKYSVLDIGLSNFSWSDYLTFLYFVIHAVKQRSPILPPIFYPPAMMYREEDPFCDICGLSIRTAFWDNNSRRPKTWREGAFAVEGLKYLPNDLETSSCPEELFTWHTSTGHTDYGNGGGHLTLLPSEDIVFQHRVNPIVHSRFVQSGHIFLGFHRACVSIAREFIQRSPVSKLHSFCDIWTTLNARHTEGPEGHGFWGKALSIPEKTARGTFVWSQEVAYYLPDPRDSTTSLTPWVRVYLPYCFGPSLY